MTPDSMLAAVKAHFPDAEILEITPDSLACSHCKAAAVPGLNHRGRALCGGCAPYAEGIANMSKHEVEMMEDAALAEGGAAGGAYLDKLDKTDLATLDGDQWAEFLRRVLRGYSAFMQAKAREAPPF